jgi:hypothetical protein
MPTKKRTYNKDSNPPRTYEYDKKYQKRPEQAEAQASRKRARRMLEAEGKVKPKDGLEVDHKNSNPHDNSRSNLRVMSKSANRARTKNGKKV